MRRLRAHLLYAPWMARDYFLWGGVATAVIIAAVGGLMTEALIGAGARTNPTHPLSAVPPQMLHRTEAQLLMFLSFVGAVIATRGIVSNDRTSAHYRLLFARPINGPMYYALSFVVNGIGFLVVATALQIAWSIFVAPMWSPRFLPIMALSYLFLGGIAFVLSALWRYDVLSFIGVYAAAAMSWDVLRSPGPKGWLLKARWLVQLLPPVDLQTDLASAVATGAALNWVRVGWVGAYGVACFALGLWVVKSRQFAKGS